MALTLNDWLVKLESLHPKAIDLGLERIARVAKNLHILPFNCPVITVTGTNGKGSCVALLEQTFIAAGYRVAAYTSPHLFKYNERLRIQGELVSDAMLCEAFAQVEIARGNLTLTYFEFGTLAALWIMHQLALNIVILEVGLGGRLDAVNIVDADIAIISTVALDHTDWLGADREAIGYEKAGIFRSHKPAVCGDFATPTSVIDYARQMATPLYCQRQDFAYEKTHNTWKWWNAKQQLIDLPQPKIELQNVATVLQAFSLLPNHLAISRAAIEQALKTVSLPGRFQIIGGPIQRIFDVAHNPAAAQCLAARLAEQPSLGNTYAVIAMLEDKDMAGTVAPLLPVIDIWHVAGLAVPRGGDATRLSKALTDLGAKRWQAFTTVEAAYQHALNTAKPNDRIIIFGSFYTVAQALSLRL